MAEAATRTIHATCVSLGGEGVLLRGPSGSGKSDLGLRLVDRGGRLVSDDRVRLARRGGCLLASAPAPLRGLIEVRGLGILRVAPVDDAPVRLVVELRPGETPERMPEDRSVALLGVAIPVVALDPFHASAPAAVTLMLDNLAGSPPRSVTVLEA